jgi:hypothetical protein
VLGPHVFWLPPAELDTLGFVSEKLREGPVRYPPRATLLKRVLRSVVRLLACGAISQTVVLVKIQISRSGARL